MRTFDHVKEMGLHDVFRNRGEVALHVLKRLAEGGIHSGDVEALEHLLHDGARALEERPEKLAGRGVVGREAQHRTQHGALIDLGHVFEVAVKDEPHEAAVAVALEVDAALREFVVEPLDRAASGFGLGVGRRGAVPSAVGHEVGELPADGLLNLRRGPRRHFADVELELRVGALIHHGVRGIGENPAQLLGNRGFRQKREGDVRGEVRPIGVDEVFHGRAKGRGERLESRRILDEMRDRVDVREKRVADAFAGLLGVAVDDVRLAVENEVREELPRRGARVARRVGLRFARAQHVRAHDAVDALAARGDDLAVELREEFEHLFVVDALRVADRVEKILHVLFGTQVSARGGDRELREKLRARRAEVRRAVAERSLERQEGKFPQTARMGRKGFVGRKKGALPRENPDGFVASVELEVRNHVVLKAVDERRGVVVGLDPVHLPVLFEGDPEGPVDLSLLESDLFPADHGHVQLVHGEAGELVLEVDDVLGERRLMGFADMLDDGERDCADPERKDPEDDLSGRREVRRSEFVEVYAVINEKISVDAVLSAQCVDAGHGLSRVRGGCPEKGSAGRPCAQNPRTAFRSAEFTRECGCAPGFPTVGWRPGRSSPCRRLREARRSIR